MSDQGSKAEEEVVAWRLKMMTTQRFSNLMEVADVIGDMGADGIDVLRKLGDPDYKNMRRFLREGKSETFEFLASARKEEILELQNGIELVRAFKTTGRVVKWAIISVGTTLAAVIAIKSWLIGKS
ncbi:hypothetical protein [uncultured Bradyrhizobium sp.]